MSVRFLTLCLVLTASISKILGQNTKDCANIASVGGMKFDLSPVLGKELSTTDGFSNYQITVCKDALKCGNCPNAGFCQTNEFFNDCMGKFSGASATVDGKGLTIYYDGGDFGNSGQLRLNCKPDAVEFENIQGQNFYKVIVADSKYACPVPLTQGGALSIGSGIMITIAVLLVVYLTGGILWNKFKQEKDGMELVPNVEFWSSLPGLVKEGFQFTIEKIRGVGSV